MLAAFADHGQGFVFGTGAGVELKKVAVQGNLSMI
jgi:hypothetical protein